MATDTIDKLKDEEKEALRIEEAEMGGKLATSAGTVKTTNSETGEHFALGLILVGVGAAFLLTNFTGLTLHNWWALFILIPAMKQFCTAWTSYQKNGRLGHNGRSALTGGLFIGLVACAFLFGISWNFVWPFFLILGGVSAILGGWFD